MPRQNTKSTAQRSASATAASSSAARGADRAPSRHLEIETKLEIPASAQLPELAGRKALKEVGLVSAAEPLVFDLDAVYFDTADFDLLNSKLTLRHRTGGEDAGWHLKLPAAAGARTEIGLPPETAETDPLTAQVPAALYDVVLGTARGKDLRPVARIRNRRTVRKLLDAAGTAMVEVADDRVTATGLTGVAGGDPEERTWRELEVEVLAGGRAQLAAVVALLQNAGATAASSASKLARALDLAPPPTAGKPKSAGLQVVSALRKMRDTVIAADRALREGTPDALHDARAAARRIESVLQVHAALFTDGSTGELREELSNFGRVLSAARDLEVLRRRLDAELDEEPGEYASVARVRLETELTAALPAALADVSEFLRSQRYLAMLRALDAFLAMPPFSKRAEKSAVPELFAQLDAAYEELAALAERAFANPFDPNRFHDVRQRSQSLRHAAESDSPTLGQSLVVFAAAAEEVQEVLDEHQIALTAAAWLAELARRPDTDGVAGFVFGRLHAFEQAVAAGAEDDFSDAWARLADGGVAALAVGR